MAKSWLKIIRLKKIFPKKRIEVIEKKAFKDMNIEERIRFLTERPFFIPPSPCEIETKTQSYFGFIESCERGVMQVRHLNRQEVFQVDRKDVTGILLLRM